MTKQRKSWFFISIKWIILSKYDIKITYNKIMKKFETLIKWK